MDISKGRQSTNIEDRTGQLEPHPLEDLFVQLLQAGLLPPPSGRRKASTSRLSLGRRKFTCQRSRGLCCRKGSYARPSLRTRPV